MWQNKFQKTSGFLSFIQVSVCQVVVVFEWWCLWWWNVAIKDSDPSPIGSMSLVYLPTCWLIFMVKVGIYTIHGCYMGNGISCFALFRVWLHPRNSLVIRPSQITFLEKENHLPKHQFLLVPYLFGFPGPVKSSQKEWEAGECPYHATTGRKFLPSQDGEEVACRVSLG